MGSISLDAGHQVHRVLQKSFSILMLEFRFKVGLLAARNNMFHDILTSQHRNVCLLKLHVKQDGPDAQPSALALLLDNATAATTTSLRNKIAYALSACLGNNGDVQLRFGSLGGETVLSAMYDASGSDFRVKMKTLTLMSDLLQEAARGAPAAVLATMPIGSVASSGGAWCRRVDEVLQHAPTPGALEKAINAVESFAPSCRIQFAELGTKQRLEGLAQQCRLSRPEGFGQVEAEFQQELLQRLEESAIALR